MDEFYDAANANSSGFILWFDNCPLPFAIIYPDAALPKYMKKQNT